MADVRVDDLQPGDLVEMPGVGRWGVHISTSDHPTYPGLRLVVWRMDDGSFSFDALDPRQVISELLPTAPAERLERLRLHLEGES